MGAASIHVLFLNVAEYIGNVPAEKREEVIQQLNKEVEVLVMVSLLSSQSICTISSTALIILVQDAVPVGVEKNEKGILIRDLKPQS